MSFEIWMEGYRVQGGAGTATLLNVINAPSWDNAVAQYMSDNPGVIDVHDKEDGTKRYTNWGCALYDNEEDARKGFG